MAGKPTDMSKIKQVLQLHEQGHSNRQISKETGINKETVNNYVNQYKKVEDFLYAISCCLSTIGGVPNKVP